MLYAWEDSMHQLLYFHYYRIKVLRSEPPKNVLKDQSLKEITALYSYPNEMTNKTSSSSLTDLFRTNILF